jgi:hypothetical protein
VTISALVAGAAPPSAMLGAFFFVHEAPRSVVERKQGALATSRLDTSVTTLVRVVQPDRTPTATRTRDAEIPTNGDDPETAAPQTRAARGHQPKFPIRTVR